MDDVDTVHAGHARKHPAPEGALRLVAGGELADDGGVRKYPAPEGALRLGYKPGTSLWVLVRKHPAPEGALRLMVVSLLFHLSSSSESTQHQKAY
nr:hypothetical protein [Actinomyces oris]